MFSVYLLQVLIRYKLNNYSDFLKIYFIIIIFFNSSDFTHSLMIFRSTTCNCFNLTQ